MSWLIGVLETLRGWMHALWQWVESLAAHPSGDWALFGIAFAESSFFPIPPDVLLVPLCLGVPERAFQFAAICTVGSVLGGAAGYGLGYVGGRPLLRWLFNAQRVASVAAYYDRYNAWATGIAGLTPLPYKLFTVSGGAFGIRFGIFLLASVLSRGLRFFAEAALLFYFGDTARVLVEKYFNWLALAFVILLILGFVVLGRGVGRAGRGGEEIPAPGEGEGG
jgi:membrane protein YqaA with SNARE-associated domain